MVRRKQFAFGPLVCAALLCSVSGLSSQLAQADGDPEVSLDDIRAQLSANAKETKTGDAAEATTVKANGAAANSNDALKPGKEADLDEETKRLEDEEQKVLARIQPTAVKSAVKEPSLKADPGLQSSDLGTIPDKKIPPANKNIDQTISSRSNAADSASLPEIPVVKQAPIKAADEKHDFVSQSSKAADTQAQETKIIKGASSQSNSSALTALRSENEELKRKIEENETKSTTLLAQLEEARNRLIIAETEVERLSSVLDARNNAAVSSNAKSASQASNQTQGSIARQVPAESDDMPIATVTADKAQLRAGPSMSDSPLMAITKGTRLAVETRRGEWLRVISPAGSRAWVNLDVVSFGPKTISSGNKSSDLGNTK
jgi:chromosome segregation ATPase